jgi:hypothetical protein
MRCTSDSPLDIAPNSSLAPMALRLVGEPRYSFTDMTVYVQVTQSLSRGRHLYTYDMLSYYMFSAANALQSPIHVSFTAMLCWRIIIRPCHRQSRAGGAEGS